MSRIAIATDAWHPQINGVVTTLSNTIKELEVRGHEVLTIAPDPASWRSWSLPFDRDIKLEFLAKRRVRRDLEKFDPDYIHISTEGPLGLATRRFCLDTRRPFTTAFHTKFADYVAIRLGTRFRHRVQEIFGARAADRSLAYVGDRALDFQRWFHAPSGAIMVATDSIERELANRRFRPPLVPWSRGVDTEQFRPYGKDFPPYAHLPRPILEYMGRIEPEKNLPAFLDLETPGSKIVVGGGSFLGSLRSQYPAVHFTDQKTAADLGRHVAAADIFVFPSKTDTFGLVILEALACGLPVVAYPVAGPIDILGRESCRGFSRLDDDLGAAVHEMIDLWRRGAIDSDGARAHALTYSWSEPTRQFYENMRAHNSIAR